MSKARTGAARNRRWRYSMDYEPVIGLETHVQLNTRSKLWCGCANEFGAPPNTNVCPVCLGMPGVLPVANEEALRLTALTGLLLNCAVSRYAKFDRKNYFYPDMPKNYQITQYDKPSAVNGHVDFEFQGGLTRVRSNTKSCASSACSKAEASSRNRRAAGTTSRKSPKRCARRNTPMITAIFPSLT